MQKKWMIYGAYGYTGKLMIREALKKGKKPIIAGRDDKKLYKFSQDYDLKYKYFELNDIDEIAANLEDIDVIYNLAGPYSQTSDNIIQACIKSKTHYLDLAGEIEIYENAFSYNSQALANNIAIICGAGFNVVATESAAALASSMIDNCDTIEVAMAALTSPSYGTFSQTMEILPKGGKTIVNGEYVNSAIGSERKFISYGDLNLMSYTVPMGELPVIKRSCEANNIKVYLSLSKPLSTTFDFFHDSISKFSSKRYGKVILKKFAKHFIKGPTIRQNMNENAYVWATAASKTGAKAEIVISTPEAYYFTVKVGVKIVEELMSGNYSGALTPVQAFGKDMILGFNDVKIISDSGVRG